MRRSEGLQVRRGWNAGGAAMVVAGAAGLMVLAGCAGPTMQVSRVDPRTTVDVDYRFNDSDARQVYQAMVNDALYRRWIDRANAQFGREPTVIVGTVRNDTSEYIDTRLFTTSFERELLNSERVRFVATRDQRGEVREERLQGQEWNTPETRKRIRAERGADFILVGRIADDKPRTLDGRGGVAYYKVTLELIDLESNDKVWIGEHEIKKVWRVQ